MCAHLPIDCLACLSASFSSQTRDTFNGAVLLNHRRRAGRNLCKSRLLLELCFQTAAPDRVSPPEF